MLIHFLFLVLHFPFSLSYLFTFHESKGNNYYTIIQPLFDVSLKDRNTLKLVPILQLLHVLLQYFQIYCFL